MAKLLVVLLFIIQNTYASNSEKEKELKRKEILDFKAIKNVIKNDSLEKNVKKEVFQIKKLKKDVKQENVSKFNYPAENEFWTFISEYWLVKNAPIIKWDFKKPDYGIEKAFQQFLEKFGFYEIKFKILMVDTPNISHFSLPADSNEYIFLLSVPFLRILDLSKLEISLLLFEDLLRSKNKIFRGKIKNKKIAEIIGQNFYQKNKVSKPNYSNVKKIMEEYDEIIYIKGFDFRQQFLITQKMNKYLKSNLRLWNVYYKLLEKIDNLVKSNILYGKYTKIYPSPEVQLNWLRPKEKSRF